MARAVEWIDRRFYPAYGKNWDDVLFRDRILAVVSPDAEVLDLGAGAGIVEQMNFRGLVKRVSGADLDPRVVQNPYLDVGRVADGSTLPFDDESFDVVFADNVLEHLERPSEVFAEIRRVLKPGGMFLAKTPNKWHYMPTIARITPLAFHRFVNRLRGRQESDTFPTVYRANSVAALTALAADTGLQVVAIDRVEGRPEYLRLNPLTYLLGLAYERIVNRFSLLECFRILLIAEFRKVSESTPEREQ